MTDLDWFVLILEAPVAIFLLSYLVLGIVELITGKCIKSLEGL